MGQTIDLLVELNDLKFNSSFVPEYITGSLAIAQDVKHMIIESGLLVPLIGQRNKWQVEKVLIEVELLIETDDRLLPGTINVSMSENDVISVSAKVRELSE
jgi:hypothetical protein